jgi:hypothetical protein
MKWLNKLYNAFINKLAKQIVIEQRQFQLYEKWVGKYKAEIHRERAIAKLMGVSMPSTDEIYKTLNQKYN